MFIRALVLRALIFATPVVLVATSLALAIGPTDAEADSDTASPMLTPRYLGAREAAAFARKIRVPAPRSSAGGDLQVAVVSLGSPKAHVATPPGWTRLGRLATSARGHGPGKVYLFSSRTGRSTVFRTRGARRAWHVVRTAYRDASDHNRPRLVRHVGRTHPSPELEVQPSDVVVSGVVTTRVAGVRLASEPGWSRQYRATRTRQRLSMRLDYLPVGEAGRVVGVHRSDRRANSISFGIVLSFNEPDELDDAADPVVDPPPPPLPTGMTATSGTPWRSGIAANPGYANTPIPPMPRISSAETARVRSLPWSLLNIDRYAEPIYYLKQGTPTRTIRCVKYGCIGGNSAPLSGNEIPASGSDGQLIVVDLENRLSYEMYQVARDRDGTVAINEDGSVTVGSMSIADLDGRGNTTREGKKLNITGAGVSRMFGVIRAHEVQAAASRPATAIPHALQVSLPSAMNCRNSFREPATKTDGAASGSDCVEEGARVQLDPSFDCAASSPKKLSQAVCFAMQNYGAFVMDNTGSNVLSFYAQHRVSWASGTEDYRKVGFPDDYGKINLPMNRLRVLASWNGE